jgi:xylulokinase
VAYVVGIDLGTQSLKAVACDERLGVIAEYHQPIDTHHRQPGWAEQDPSQWDAALEAALARFPRDEIRAIGVAGQLDGCVPVDAQARAVAPALIWQDRRAIAEVTRVDPARVHALTGQIADASHMAAKIRWLRARGLRAVRFHQPVSYLVARMTGAAVMDPSHASTTMLYDLASGAWSPELLAAFEIDPAELPVIRPACAIAGEWNGIPVAVGTGDDFATPLGAGLAGPGPIACVLGTAEVVGGVAARPVLDVRSARAVSGGGTTGAASGIDPWHALAEPMVETHAYPTGAFFVENPGWLSGGAVKWAVRLLGLSDERELDALAAGAPAGAAGVTFVPALAGAMTPVWRAEARASFHGLTAAHDRAHAARAILEGLAFACRDVVGRLAALGLSADSVLALGGGARSHTWMQLRADALARPHHVAARSDTSAIGAAMIAAVAVGILPDLVTAAALIPPPTATYLPATNLDEAYAQYRDSVQPK